MNNPVSNPITGAGYFLHGLKLITHPALRRFVAIPLAINLLLFSGLIWFGASQFESLLNSFMPDLPGWLQWANWLFWLLFGVATLLILFFAFSLLANIIAAPFNGLLAEAVEMYLTGRQQPGDTSWKKALVELVPTLVGELRKLLYLLVRTVPLLLLFVIPVINIAAPFIWITFSAWMLALEYADYPMGNHGLCADEQKQRLREKRLMSLGFGGAVTLATMIPILNFLVMPAAVAGATAMWVEQFEGLTETSDNVPNKD
ncbi:MAG TPA: sulfate transporter CysZ [Gammaproteobacteria bacterium]|nr:sulfate transporter CysZ [Gammaproteobacteria bacterium]